jgi:hypothetical protein
MLSTADIAETWRAAAYLEYDWRAARGHCRDGHGGGAVMMAPPLGRSVYLKPRRALVPEAAALEKIASDLAHDLGVRVPPVVLTNHPSGWGGAAGVCASLVMYGFQLHWGAAAHGVRNHQEISVDEPSVAHARAALRAGGLPGDLILAAAREAAAAALVFDTWVGQPDHDHPSNIAWGMSLADETDHGLCFFDYEMALGVGGWPAVGPAPFPRELLDQIDARGLERAIAAVEALPAHDIGAVVRIPESYLRSERKEDIVTHLIHRRQRLREALTPVPKRQS